MNEDDKIAPPKRPLTFGRALRGSVRRNFWLILLFFTFLGMVAIRGVAEGSLRSSLINFLALLLILLVVGITIAPTIRKQNEEHRLKRDSETKP